MADDLNSEDTWKVVVAAAEERLRRVEVPDDPSPPEVGAATLGVSGWLAGRWRAEQDRLVHRHAVERAEFTDILRETWGPALDDLLHFIEACERFGGHFVVTEPAETRTQLSRVLLDLHAAACTVAHEVHWLLAGGYPRGAWARTRTLHEIDVTTRVLADHGTSDPGLVTRYIDHDQVRICKEQIWLASHHEEVGADPPAPELVNVAKRRLEELEAAHTKAYLRNYGWAVAYCPSGKFADLEKLAGRSDRRPYYQDASARAVHANANLVREHHVLRGDVYERLSNATTRGLARPAALTAHYLTGVCDAVLDGGSRRDSYEPMLGVLAIKSLRDDVTNTFAVIFDSGDGD